MPKSKVSRKKKFREYSKLNQRYVKNNYLKKYHLSVLYLCKRHNIHRSELELLVWGYDLEFFTARAASEGFGLLEESLKTRTLNSLQKKKFVYVHFSYKDTSKDELSQMFDDGVTSKHIYRHRYGITQKARLIVQQLYRSLE